MICRSCAGAADRPGSFGHPPEICCDYGLTPSGCGCQHQPRASQRPQEATRAPSGPMETDLAHTGAHSGAQSPNGVQR